MAAVTPVSHRRQEVLVLAPKEWGTVWKKRVTSSVMCLQPNGARVTITFRRISVFLPQESTNTLLCTLPCQLIYVQCGQKLRKSWAWPVCSHGICSAIPLSPLFRGAVVTQQLKNDCSGAMWLQQFLGCCNNRATVSHYHPNSARIWGAPATLPVSTFVHSF